MDAPERDKVIRGLESLRDICNAKADMAIGEGRTAWAGYASVVHLALDLLRELIPVEPLHKCVGNGSNTLIADASYAYCPFCGRRIERHD